MLAEQAKKQATEDALSKEQAEEAGKARGQQLIEELMGGLMAGNKLVYASLDGWDREALMEEEKREKLAQEKRASDQSAIGATNGTAANGH